MVGRACEMLDSTHNLVHQQQEGISSSRESTSDACQKVLLAGCAVHNYRR